MGLDDKPVDDLINLIQDSFRVHENDDPVYVDVGGHLGRVSSAQHQIVFGRRGSGKSCLLIHYRRRRAAQDGVLAMYVNADEVKNLSYPDLLIRLLLSILESLPKSPRRRRFWKRKEQQPIERMVQELRSILEESDSVAVTQQTATEREMGGTGSIRAGSIGASVQGGQKDSEAETAEFVRRKRDYLDRHLQDIKSLLGDALGATEFRRGAVIVDDFYLIHTDVQPDVVDYLHQLLRGTDFYLKIATVRHRSRLARHGGKVVGVELGQDVEAVNLDQTFEDLGTTQDYLTAMVDSLGNQVGIESASSALVSSDGLFALTLASGGVPRDYLTIFMEAIQAARSDPQVGRVTPRSVYRGAARVSYRQKLINLRSDAGGDAQQLEKVFTDLLEFTLKERRKTAFLVSQDEANQDEEAHELIQQLMDFKLIHVIVPDTSAASGREGRYEAYTLDAASFMEPRRRGIEVVEFWRSDDQSRPLGVREAPVYPLTRASTSAKSKMVASTTEEAIANIDSEVPSLEE